MNRHRQLLSLHVFNAQTIPSVPTPLCKHHYHIVYNLLQPTQTHCITCGVSLKWSTPKYCTQPEVIEKHLNEHTGFEGSIGAHDRSDCASPATNHAILLPSVQDYFNSYACELLAAKSLQDGVEANKLASSRRILSNLTANVLHHLSYSCRIFKYGTLLYRPNSDVLASLTQALWRLRNLGAQQDNDSELASNPPDTSSEAKVLMSKFICKLKPSWKRMLRHFWLDIDQLIQETNPHVWEAICSLTRSVSERRGTTKNVSSSHTKKVRRFFLLSALLFCTDERCSMPLHTLLTDLVDSQGGTKVLVKILNRFGICDPQTHSHTSFTTKWKHRRTTSSQAQKVSWLYQQTT